MKTYLVTGGYGFIGSHLVRKLINLSHKVIILDNLSSMNKNAPPEEVEFIFGDVTDKEILSDVLKRVDYCVHLAAIASVTQCDKDWTQANIDNYLSILYIFECIKEKQLPVEVVYASSAAIYGDLDSSEPLSETMRPLPISIYGSTKLACENLSRITNTFHNIPTVGLRFFNVYGVGQNAKSEYAGVISLFNKKIELGENLIVFGDGLQTRDFIYIDDVVNAIIKACEHVKVKLAVFNICSGKACSINNLIKILEKIHDTKVDVEYKPLRNFEILQSLGNPLRAKKHIDFVAKNSIEEGLRKMILD